MEKMYGKTIKELGISYLGSVAQSAKTRLSYKNGTMTYCLYLAPWNMSGHNVCPKGEHCHKHCLNGSGQNKCQELYVGAEQSRINRSRIKKTNLFYEDRATFMELLIHEIKSRKARAEKLGFEFSVRLNGTSDLSPLLFRDPKSGKTILDLFPNVTFYDYTKVYNRIGIMDSHKNYDVTFSYDGYNDEECERFLNEGGRVAVVFYGKKLPQTFNGWRVVDGNTYDMRYLDPKQSIIGLHYHVTANDYQVINGKRQFVVPSEKFIVMPNDSRCSWG